MMIQRARKAERVDARQLTKEEEIDGRNKSAGGQVWVSELWEKVETSKKKKKKNGYAGSKKMKTLSLFVKSLIG